MQERLRAVPGDTQATRLSASTEKAQNNFAKSREILRTLIDKGRATAQDMNTFAWQALFTGTVTPEDIEIAQRGLSLQYNRDWATMHTLACLYAEVGQTKQARDLLIKVMELDSLDEPNGLVWYGLERIAEQYGEYEAARKAYNRVEPPKQGAPVSPDSTYALMLPRMKIVEAELRKNGTAAGK